MLALAAHGWTLRGLVSDTALAAYLVRPDQRSYDLADLTLRYLKRELRSRERGRPGAAVRRPAGGDDSPATAMLHARAVLDLAEALDVEVEERGGTRLLADVELPLVHVLDDMERIGIAVDADHLEPLESALRRPRCEQAADEAYAVIGKEINLGSPKQLQVVLFDELDMPKTKRTKTGYTTDADALQALYVKTEHPFLLAPAAPPRRRPAAPDHRGPAQDGRARRPHPHDVQPDDRRHRPALQHRPQPAEHPDPHRGGPPDPRGVRRRARLRVR